MDDEAKIPENMCENIPNSIQCVRVRDEHDDTPSGPVRCVSGFDQCCMSDVVTTMGNHTQTHHSWLVGQIFRSIFRFFNQVFSVRFSTQFTRRDETFRKNGEQEKKHSLEQWKIEFTIFLYRFLSNGKQSWNFSTSSHKHQIFFCHTYSISTSRKLQIRIKN